MKIAALRNPIQRYDWGSHTHIASLQGRTDSTEPEAELWMGAYPESPSEVMIDGSWQPLHTVLERFVAPEITEGFGKRLPFLMKYLAIARPLSIQVHPDDEGAAQGFAEGSFKDPYGKPELIYALTPVEMLVGFKPAAEVVPLLAHLGRQDLVEDLEEMSSGQVFVRSLTDLTLLDEVKNAPHLARELSWLPELLIKHPHDPAATAPLFMNHIYLQPGEAIYVPTGTVHCYLNGFGVEVMATSDNVIRAGMTSKSVDLPHFMEHATLEAAAPHYVQSVLRDGWQIFPTPSPEFELSRGEVASTLTSRGVAILTCSEGEVKISSDSEHLTVGRGDSAIVASDCTVTISGDGVIYRCALPTS